jgi:hypothetical protein
MSDSTKSTAPTEQRPEVTEPELELEVQLESGESGEAASACEGCCETCLTILFTSCGGRQRLDQLQGRDH